MRFNTNLSEDHCFESPSPEDAPRNMGSSDIDENTDCLSDSSSAFEDDDPLSRLWWKNDSAESIETGNASEVNFNMGLMESSDDSESDNIPEDRSDGPDTFYPISDHEFLQVPSSLKSLRERLLGDYRCPESQPELPPCFRQLTLSEIYSLQHYSTWVRTNGTVEAYRLHAEVLACASKTVILSLREVKKLAQSLTDFKPRKVDMCPRSCIAYTGDYKMLTHCPYVSSGKNSACNEPRYRPLTSRSSRLQKPRAEVQILPVMATIRAMYANANTSRLMRNRDSCLKEALHLIATAATRRYSDYGNSQVHLLQYERLGLFREPRDVALAISSDGAQLTLKKQSNTWLLIFLILNLPGSIRYKTSVTIINFATPGPNPPGDIESFLWPVFEEMAKASEGIWTWDAVDSSYFCLRACISMALGDMLGSAKLNGMAGHTALHGDRFSMVRGAKSSLTKGSKSQYYPISPPDNDRYNPQRPAAYDLSNLPMRTQQSYWETIERLEKARTKKDKAEIMKMSGVSRLPLCAASVAFLHPTFFPLDPFHIFYENDLPFIWDTWTILSKDDDRVHLPAEKAQALGHFISLAMETLPPVFCGPVRDPFLKRQSQYKAYEWMALLHWYIVPMGIELGFDPAVLKNFSRFVRAVEFSMTIEPRSEKDLEELRSLIITFLEEYERLYIGDNPEKIHRARLCIFQLIHVPLHIQWNGSIRLGSQATVERSIGEMGHKIRSKKAPFSNLANLIYQRELLKILALYYPEIDPSAAIRPPNQVPPPQKLFQKRRVAFTKLGSNSEISKEIDTLSKKLSINLDDPDTVIQRYGKLKLSNGHVLASRCSYPEWKTGRRRSEWFEVRAALSLTFAYILNIELREYNALMNWVQGLNWGA